MNDKPHPFAWVILAALIGGTAYFGYLTFAKGEESRERPPLVKPEPPKPQEVLVKVQVEQTPKVVTRYCYMYTDGWHCGGRK